MGKLFAGIVLAMVMGMELLGCNINTASVEELSQLKGIGKSTAEKIVAYRQEHLFKSTEELMQIKGIGAKKYEAIKSDVSI